MQLTHAEKFALLDAPLANSIRERARAEGSKNVVRAINALVAEDMADLDTHIPTRSLFQWRADIRAGMRLTNFGPACLAAVDMLLGDV